MGNRLCGTLSEAEARVACIGELRASQPGHVAVQDAAALAHWSTHEQKRVSSWALLGHILTLPMFT